MAITQDAWAIQAESNANPVVMAFDCNGGDLLVLGFTSQGARPGGTPTYNGVNMTDSGQGHVDSGAESRVEMWYLVNPAAGVNDISIPNTNVTWIVPIASAWSGVNTADPLDTSNNNHGNTSANPSCQVTTTAVNELVIDILMSGRNNSPPSANSHVLIVSQDNTWNSSNAQYTTAQDPFGNITLSWTQADADWAMIVCAFKVEGEVPPPTRRVFLIH